MKPPAESHEVRNCRGFSHAVSVLAVLTGSLALLGWVFDLKALTSVRSGLASMKPSTALCFIFAGLSLWLIQLQRGERSSSRIERVQVARVFGCFIGVVALLTIVEYLFHKNLGFDEALFSKTLLAAGGAHPGRMAGATALGFIFLATSLLLSTTRSLYPAQGLAVLAALNGFVACIGYLLDAHPLYDVPAYSSMALQTAVLFFLLGLAALAARPQGGLMAVVTSEHLGGVMARRVLPLIIVLVMLLGWLRWRGELSGLYGTEFGIALLILSEVVVFVALLWFSGMRLNNLDEANRQAQAQRLLLAAIVESSDDAILSKDLSGIITSWNRGAELLYGFSATEMIGTPVAALMPEERQEEAEQFLTLIARGQLVTAEDTVRRRKDGSLVHVSLVISPVRDLQGEIVGASAIAHDITKRKRAEELIVESEKNYRTLFESMDEGFCTIEVLLNKDNHPMDYRFLDVNPVFEKLTGIPNARGRTMREIAPQHEEYWFETLGRIALTGEPARFENWAEELHRWYEVHAFRIGEPQERKVAVFFDDITKRKGAEEALRASEEKFRTVANTIPQMVWMANSDGWIFWYNQGWYDYTGTTPQQMEGWGWQSVHDPEELPRVMERWQACIATGEPFEMTFPLRSARGEFRSFLRASRR